MFEEDIELRHVVKEILGKRLADHGIGVNDALLDRTTDRIAEIIDTEIRHAVANRSGR